MSCHCCILKSRFYVDLTFIYINIFCPKSTDSLPDKIILHCLHRHNIKPTHIRLISGVNCSERTGHTSAQMSSVTDKLLKEPIWVGMIVMFNLLLLFGALYIAKRRCGRYVPCCRDTKEMLRRRGGIYLFHCGIYFQTMFFLFLLSLT